MLADGQDDLSLLPYRLLVAGSEAVPKMNQAKDGEARNDTIQNMPV
jgi:hypothetical protein